MDTRLDNVFCFCLFGFFVCLGFFWFIWGFKICSIIAHVER